jgi:transaldolase
LTLYIRGLAAPNTVDTMPEKTLLAFADHGQVEGAIPREGGDAEHVLAAFTRAGFDLGQLAARLQDEGTRSFVASWNGLIGAIEEKGQRVR